MLKLRLQQFEGVAFDFDGTLADSQEAHDAARVKAFEDLGYGHVSAEEHALGHTYGTRPETIIGGVLKAAGIVHKEANPDSDPVIAEVVQRKKLHYREAISSGLDEQPGATAFLRKVAERARNLTIVTTAHLYEVAPFLARYGLRDLLKFEDFITAESIESHGLAPKPAPDPYALAMQQMKMSHPSKLLAIEDSPGGIQSAKLAGATVLAVCTTSTEEQLRAAEPNIQPDLYAQSFADIRIA